MKKLFLLVLMGIGIYLNAFSQINKISIQHVVTVGQSVTIDPLADINVPRDLLQSMSGMLNTSDYNTLVTSNFTYTSSVYSTNSENSAKGFVYTITPQKIASTSFCIRLTHYYYREYHATTLHAYEITYTIVGVDVTKITIPSELSLTVGESYTFSPVIADSRAQTSLTWTSSRNSVASVDANGKVTANGVGTADITCTASNGVSAKCTITVEPVYIESVTMNETDCTLFVGDKKQLSVTVMPQDASIKEMQWSSSDTKVAMVDQNGLVTAVGSGVAQITAAAKDGSGKSASCVVTVEKDNKLTVTDVAQCNGGRGLMNVLLSDEETILGFQFDLELPTGVTVPTDDSGNLIAQLTGNAANTHSISSRKTQSGLYRFIVSSNTGEAISNANGDGMSITFDVADDVQPGIYAITLKNIEMTVKRTGSVYEDLHPKNSTAQLTVVKAIAGDVNGDGKVTVTDLSSIIGYIQGDVPVRFIQKSADMNNDGKVSITDAVRVIDVILSK